MCGGLAHVMECVRPRVTFWVRVSCFISTANEMLFSWYFGRMEIARQTGLKTSSSESGIHVPQHHLLHLVVVARSQCEVTPVDCGHTLRSRPACLCWMVDVLASSVIPSSLTLLKAVCIMTFCIF